MKLPESDKQLSRLLWNPAETWSHAVCTQLIKQDVFVKATASFFPSCNRSVHISMRVSRQSARISSARSERPSYALQYNA